MPLSDSPVWWRSSRPLLWALIALPVFLTFNYVFRFGVNVPKWDDFDLVPLIDKLHQGTLTLQDLFSQHNEHRLFFPRLVMLASAGLTRYNVLVQMYVGWALLCGILALLLVEHRRTFGTSPSALVLFVPVAWLVCTLRQGENLLWGWQLQIYLNVLTFLLAAWFAQDADRSLWRLLACLASGIVSSYSFGSGLAVWPFLVLYCLYLARLRGPGGRGFRRVVVLCGAVGALVMGLYLRGYVKPGHHPATSYVLEHPGEAVHFLMAILGSPLCAEARGATAFGVLLTALFAGVAVLWLRGEVDGARAAFALPLLLIALSAALMVLVGRVGLGLEAALPSRYTTMTVLGVVGLYRAVLALRRERLRQLLGGAVTAVILAGLVAMFDGPYEYGRSMKADRRHCIELMAGYRTHSNPELMPLGGNPAALRETYLPTLEKYHLSIYAEASDSAP